MTIQPVGHAVGPASDVPSGLARCPFCGETTPPGTRRCPRCLPIAPTAEEPLPAAAAPAPARAREGLGAVYRLEASARCPHCAKDVTAIRVLRALPAQVSFTSTLPRKAYVIVCPECTGMLASALSGVI